MSHFIFIILYTKYFMQLIYTKKNKEPFFKKTQLHFSDTLLHLKRKYNYKKSLLCHFIFLYIIFYCLYERDNPMNCVTHPIYSTV